MGCLQSAIWIAKIHLYILYHQHMLHTQQMGIHLLYKFYQDVLMSKLLADCLLFIKHQDNFFQEYHKLFLLLYILKHCLLLIKWDSALKLIDLERQKANKIKVRYTFILDQILNN